MINLLGTHLISINCIPRVANRQEATKSSALCVQNWKEEATLKHFHLHFQWCRLKKGIPPDPLSLPKRYSRVPEDHLSGFHGTPELHDEK